MTNDNSSSRGRAALTLKLTNHGVQLVSNFTELISSSRKIKKHDNLTPANKVIQSAQID